MKNVCLLISILFLFLISNDISAQSKYGNVTMDEMNMTVYPADTTAAAVILLKDGDTRFIYSDLNGFQFEYTLKMKIKILKTEGLSWCDQSVSYYESDRQSKEKITGLSGTAYTLENGKIVKTKLLKEHISDEDINNKWKLKKFSLSGAKIGSVVEFKYTIVSDFFYELRDFYFQSSIPTLFALYDVTIPEYFTYNVNNQGYERVEAKREPQNMSFHISGTNSAGQKVSGLHSCTATRYLFQGTDIPALKPEPFVWTLDDYRTKVTFELRSEQFPYSMIRTYTTNWANIDRQLFEMDSYGGNLKKTSLFKNEITATEQTLEKAKEIQNAIKYKVKWNEKSAFYPSNLANSLKSGMGNSADLNFLLINALKAGGFDAFPVVLSTRNNGRLPVAHPSISALNYVITGIQLDTMMYFTDASAEYGDWNILPEKCMVDNARRLQEGKSDWIDLSKISSSMEVKMFTYKFTDSNYEATVSDTRRGNPAYGFKRDYYKNHKDKEEFIEKLAVKLNGEIENFETTNLDNTDQDLNVKYVLKTESNLGEEFLYINPMGEKHIAENPFKSEERKYPVSFNYPYTYRQIATIEIPEGYAVEELPKSESIANENNTLSLTYRIASDGNKIIMRYIFQLSNVFFLQSDSKGFLC